MAFHQGLNCVRSDAGILSGCSFVRRTSAKLGRQRLPSRLCPPR